jgi:hypothetical protein
VTVFRFRLHFIGFVLLGLGHAAGLVSAAETTGSRKIIGMYIHQHWAYNHPYSARTWTVEDWRGYLDGLSRLGYNMVLIWPMLETMPNPLTPSDQAALEKIGRVLAVAADEFGLRTGIVWCPNVSARNAEARKYTFERRPFYHTDDRVDPADPVEFGKLMAWREQITRPLARTDSVFIIDSDPGGYPLSSNVDFVHLLGAHRRMLDRIRPGIEVVYWSHFGWESYSRYYHTAVIKRGEAPEAREAVSLFARQSRSEPWSVANSGFPDDFLDPIGMGDRVLSFPYGAIEGEPSFPFTLFNGEQVYVGGRRQGQRGVLGNSQTHCVQLPNTFAFARTAQGLSTTQSDYVRFASELLPAQGAVLVEGWEALQGVDSLRISAAVSRLESMPRPLRTGPLRGLLFGSPERFVADLVAQLKMVAALGEFRVALNAVPREETMVKRRLGEFALAAENWQTRHGYSNKWDWTAMDEAMAQLGSPEVNSALATRKRESEEGATPFERVKNGLARRESFTPRLIAAMKSVAGLATANPGHPGSERVKTP